MPASSLRCGGPAAKTSVTDRPSQQEELSPSLRTRLCSAIAHIIRTGVGRSRTPLTVCKFSIHSSVPIFNLASTIKGAYIHPSKAAAASLIDHRLRCRSLGLALLVPHRHAVYTVALYTWHHAPVHRQCCWMRSYVSFSPILYRLSLLPASRVPAIS